VENVIYKESFMSLIVVVASIFAGVLCAFGVLFIENAILGRNNGRRPVKLGSMAVVFTAVSVIGIFLVQPYFAKRALRSEISGELIGMKTAPVYGYMKKYDPERFTSVVVDFAEIAHAHRSATKAELYMLYNKRGGDLGIAYIRKSSPDIKRRYFESTVRILEDLNPISPDTACRYLFPEVYGVPEGNAVLNAMTVHGMFDIFEEAIRESKGNSPETGAGTADPSRPHLASYQKEFARKNPMNMSAIVNIEQMKTDNEKKILINSVIMFYKGILKKKGKKADQILNEII